MRAPRIEAAPITHDQKLEQASRASRPLEWQQAGDTYYAVKKGQIVALLYYNDGGSGHCDAVQDAGGGSSPAWHVVLAREPTKRYPLLGRGYTLEMALTEIASLERFDETGEARNGGELPRVPRRDQHEDYE